MELWNDKSGHITELRRIK